GTIVCCIGSTGKVDRRRPGQQRLVGRGQGWTPGCQPDAPAVLRQLQPEKRLLPDVPTHYHCQLEGDRRRSVGSAIRRRSRTDHETGIPASQHCRSGLRQCSSPAGIITCVAAPTTRIPVSESSEKELRIRTRDEIEPNFPETTGPTLRLPHFAAR